MDNKGGRCWDTVQDDKGWIIEKYDARILYRMMRGG
jgi:hypothetical protein